MDGCIKLTRVGTYIDVPISTIVQQVSGQPAPVDLPSSADFIQTFSYTLSGSTFDDTVWPHPKYGCNLQIFYYNGAVKQGNTVYNICPTLTHNQALELINAPSNPTFYVKYLNRKNCAPEGTVTSDYDPYGKKGYIIDKNPSTYFDAVVPNPSISTWYTVWTIDLGSVRQLSAISGYYYFSSGGASAATASIRASVDGTNWTTISSTSTSGTYVKFNTAISSARYIRGAVWQNSGTGYNLYLTTYEILAWELI